VVKEDLQINVAPEFGVALVEAHLHTVTATSVVDLEEAILEVAQDVLVAAAAAEVLLQVTEQLTSHTQALTAIVFLAILALVHRAT
jgi:hypothetical protein